MRRLLLSLLVAVPLAAAGACSLNPQPLPPGETPDSSVPNNGSGGSGGGSGSGTTAGGSSGGGSGSGSSSGSGSGGQLASDAGASNDTGVVTPAPDGGIADGSTDGAMPTGDGALSD